MAACSRVGMYSSSSESDSESLELLLEHGSMVALVTELDPKCSINCGTVIRLQFLTIY